MLQSRASTQVNLLDLPAGARTHAQHSLSALQRCLYTDSQGWVCRDEQAPPSHRPHTALTPPRGRARPAPPRSSPLPSTSGSGAAVRGSARGGPGPASGGAGSAVAKMSRGSIEIPLRDTDEASRARGGGGEGQGGRSVPGSELPPVVVPRARGASVAGSPAVCPAAFPPRFGLSGVLVFHRQGRGATL